MTVLARTFFSALPGARTLLARTFGALLLVAAAACAHVDPMVPLSGEWPAQPGDYIATTETWTRTAQLRGQYQEVLALTATFKSPEWRAAHAEREAATRKLAPDGKASLIAQAQADAAGPYELELLVATWDRAENDLQRGKKSTWHIVLVDDQGKEVEPIDIVKDRRPRFVVAAEFPALEDFELPYIARFPRTEALLGPGVHALRLRMSNEQGGVELAWNAP